MKDLATEESKQKEKFVAEYLSPLLRAAGFSLEE